LQTFMGNKITHDRVQTSGGGWEGQKCNSALDVLESKLPMLIRNSYKQLRKLQRIHR